MGNCRDAVELVVRFEKACRDCGLELVEGLAMTELLLNDGSLERSNLLSGFNPSLVSRTVNRLEERGYLFRASSDEDRRKLCIMLTDAGWEPAETLLSHFSDACSLGCGLQNVERSYLRLVNKARGMNLTITQLQCIVLIHSGVSTSDEISRNSNISRTTAHMALKGLVAHGLVEVDGERPLRFVLTPKGLSKLK